MIQLRFLGCKEEHEASELSYALSEALSGWKPFKENEVLVTDPDEDGSVYLCIGEQNDHDVTLEVEIIEN